MHELYNVLAVKSEKPSQKSVGYYNSKGELNLELDILNPHISVMDRCQNTFGICNVWKQISLYNDDYFLDCTSFSCIFNPVASTILFFTSELF